MSKKLGIKLNELIDSYNTGLTPIQIAEKYNYTNPSAITKRLKKAGVEVNRDYKKRRNNRTNKYKFDINYFEEINSNEKAYFLGLMYSDGSVTKNMAYLKLKDEEIIIKFKESLKAEQPIFHRSYDKYYSYQLIISSQKFCQDLINLGCFINKTKILRFPNIKEQYYKHFIRGFFDGDGCLQLNNNLSHCRFDLTTASLEFLNDIRPIITQQAITNGYLGKESKTNTYHLNYSGKQVIRIMNWLYEDSNNLYLTRKYNKYLILTSPIKIG